MADFTKEFFPLLPRTNLLIQQNYNYRILIFCLSKTPSIYLTGIRYPEELSFCKPLTQDDLKHNYSEKQMKKKSTATVKNGTPADTNSFISNKSHNSSTNGSLDRTSGSNHNHTLNSSGRTPISSPVSYLKTGGCVMVC